MIKIVFTKITGVELPYQRLCTSAVSFNDQDVTSLIL